MNNVSMRDAFFNRLYSIAVKDKNVMLVTADMGAPSLDQFRDKLKRQFINVGIAEQNMMTVAAGLALNGKTVFTYAIMPFVTTRCYEMLKLESSLMNLPIIAVGVGSGFSYDDSGPTHHSTEDITIMRVLPNMTIFNSSDSVMASKVADMSCALKGPGYVRLDRKIFPIIHSEQDDFSAGLKKFRDGRDICIVATGDMVHKAFEVSDRLAGHSVSAGIIDLYRLKPISAKLLVDAVGDSGRIVTMEEHLLAGGMGSSVAETLLDNDRNLPMKRFGVPDKYYYAYGGRANIQSICKLDTDTIVAGILKWLNKR